MPKTREPILHFTATPDLRPTLVTVGMREVEAKRMAKAGRDARNSRTADAARGTIARSRPGR